MKYVILKTYLLSYLENLDIEFHKSVIAIVISECLQPSKNTKSPVDA